MTSTVVIILISILFSAFFSGMEIAFVSANKIHLEIEKKQKNLNSEILNKITKKPSDFIASMIVGNNIALVIYGLFSGRLIIDLFFESVNPDELTLLYIFYQTIISTFIILMSAEFIPKVFFQIYANNVIKVFLIPAFILFNFFKPITYVVNKISNSIIKLFFKSQDEELKLLFSKDEIGAYISENIINNESNKPIDSEIEIFKNALQFSSLKAREIMVPRAEIISVDRYTSIKNIKKLFIETGFSKVLIHRESIDNIIGYSAVFDFMDNPKSLKKIIHSVQFIPESMPINDILNLLTNKRKSIAVVVDEYGGTSGIITVEDIIEELFGEIEDEYDSQYLTNEEIGKNKYIFSARVEVDYINNTHSLNLPMSENYDTLGGLIVYSLEDIPKKGQVFKKYGYKFEILDVTGTKINKIKLWIL